jgi:hypothetical protein
VTRSIWYRFTPTVTSDYTISSCAADGTATTVDDTVMAIYTSSSGACGGTFTELPSTGITDGCGDDECVTEVNQAVITTRLTAGTNYFIVVWLFDSAAPEPGNTAVQLKVIQQFLPNNDTCTAATTLLLDTPVNGTTLGATDNYRLSGSACFTGVGNHTSTAAGRDAVYTFTAPHAGNYSVRVTNYFAAEVSDLVIYAASSCPAAGGSPVTIGTCLAAVSRSDIGPAEEIACLPLAINQQIYIFVDEDTITSGDTFTIEVTRCSSSTEPNNTPGTANTFVFGVEGPITPFNDADFFSLGTFPAGSRVFAIIDGIAGNDDGDFDIRVTTSTDTLEYDDYNNDLPFGSLAPNLAGTMLTASPAFLRVDRYLENITNPSAIEPYRLYAVVQPPSASATAETEPNDTTGTANSAANNYFSGSLSGPSPSADVDVFSFTAQAGDLIFVSLDGDPLRDNTPINAELELLDPVGAALVAVDDSESISNTTSGAGVLDQSTPTSPSEGLVFRAFSSGTYFARVSIGLGGLGASGSGDYLLSITRNGVTGSCTFGISPLKRSFPGNAGVGSIDVTAGVDCDWTAVSNSPFINITSGNNGTGNGTVNYSVTANPGPGIRAGTITVAGRVFVVRQGINFADVPSNHPFYTEIGRLSANGITLGCGSGNYCPSDVVTREQMSAFLLRGRGEPNPPIAPNQRFTDVPLSNPFFNFIDRLAVLQITLGCGPNVYCPANSVTREQMAAFILRALGEFNPPIPGSQRFLDVPPSNPFYNFIDRLAELQITLGCGGGNYCPTLSVTRDQMAAFLIRAFEP